MAVAPLDSDFPPIVGAVIASRGQKAAATWLAGLKRNSQTYQDEEAVVAAVERGDVACGIVNQYYWYRLRLETGPARVKSRLSYFREGDPGSVVNIAEPHPRLVAAPAGCGALRGVPRQSGGSALIAQETTSSIRRAWHAPNPAPPLASIAHASYPVVALGDDREAARLVAAAAFGS